MPREKEPILWPMQVDAQTAETRAKLNFTNAPIAASVFAASAGIVVMETFAQNAMELVEKSVALVSSTPASILSKLNAEARSPLNFQGAAARCVVHFTAPTYTI